MKIGFRCGVLVAPGITWGKQMSSVESRISAGGIYLHYIKTQTKRIKQQSLAKINVGRNFLIQHKHAATQTSADIEKQQAVPDITRS
jgi:hypothetical protein